MVCSTTHLTGRRRVLHTTGVRGEGRGGDGEVVFVIPFLIDSDATLEVAGLGAG